MCAEELWWWTQWFAYSVGCLLHKQGRTPLHWAAFSGKEEFLRVLVNAKADPNAKVHTVLRHPHDPHTQTHMHACITPYTTTHAWAHSYIYIQTYALTSKLCQTLANLDDLTLTWLACTFVLTLIPALILTLTLTFTLSSSPLHSLPPLPPHLTLTLMDVGKWINMIWRRLDETQDSAVSLPCVLARKV